MVSGPLPLVRTFGHIVPHDMRPLTARSVASGGAPTLFFETRASPAAGHTAILRGCSSAISQRSTFFSGDHRSKRSSIRTGTPTSTWATLIRFRHHGQSRVLRANRAPLVAMSAVWSRTTFTSLSNRSSLSLSRLTGGQFIEAGPQQEGGVGTGVAVASLQHSRVRKSTTSQLRTISA